MCNSVEAPAADREPYRKDNEHFYKCKARCCTFCSYCTRAFSKERNKSRGSRLLLQEKYIKVCEKCFLCHSIVLCKSCHKCTKCCHKSTCRGQATKLLENMVRSGCRSESGSNPERGLHPTLSDPAKLVKNPYGHKLLWQSSQKSQSVGGITSAYGQKCHRTSSQTGLPRVFQPTLFSPQTQQQVETHPSLFLKTEKFKMETPETIRTSLQKGEWVTSIDFKDAYFHIPIQEQSRKYLRFHFQGQTYQFKALPFGLSIAPMEFTIIAKEVKLMAIQNGIRIHQYLDDWLVRAPSYRVCLQHTQVLVRMCRHLGWLLNVEKSELEPKEVFNFVGYQFDLESGRVRPTPDRWQSLQEMILEFISRPACSVRELMSLIGLLTATEKQVHLGRLHMRPIQWPLKRNWRILESLEKRIPLPRSLHPHLQWWLEEGNVLTGQPLHPMQHALQIFTDASKEGWGAHLNEFIARETWSLPESKLHINYLELKAVFLALKEFQNLCMGKMVLVATDNTTVVAYINKEGGMRSGPLCALLWRILTWCTGKQVTLKAQHIPGRLNVVADKLSRLGQTIQTEWSLLPEVFQALCNRWHQPQIDLFATRFNNKLPLFVSPVPDPMATAVDALSLSWENLDAYAFPPTAILGKVVEKLQDSPYQRLIIIAPGWPNMTWFWDLVEMSSQIPLL